MKYVSKFFLEIFPSVVATVVGAYIVNYYIIPKAGTDAPKAAAYSKAAPESHEDQSAIDISPKPEAASSQDKPPQDRKAQDVKEKAPAEKPADKNADKPADKPLETVKAPSEGRRTNPREKVIVKNAPSAPAEATSLNEERRDANELARAAIERSRTLTEPARPAGAPMPVQEAREPARNVVAVPSPPQHRPFVQPLPPPVSVTALGGDGLAGNAPVTVPPASSYPPAAPTVEANRPIPPADVPTASHPLDLQAAAARKSSVADDVLSAARSVINAVVPQ